MMTPRPGSAILWLMLTFFYVEGLKLTLDRTEDGLHCGELQCLADDSTQPHNILSVIGMSIYDITHPNIPLKVASVSAFTPGVLVEPSKVSVINATGAITKNQASLALMLLSGADCRFATFQCELDFVNTDGQSDIVRESISPPDDNATLLNIMAQMAAQMKAQTDALNNALQEFSRIEKYLNTSCTGNNAHGTDSTSGVHAVSCYRGMPNTNPREKFNLWNQTVALCDTQTDGGGWVIIQRRTKGDVSFYRSWNDYKKGFGTPDTDFWIGNDIIHNLTSHGYNELRIEFEIDGEAFYGQWAQLNVSNEQSKYRLTTSGISGTIYDNFLDTRGFTFSTYDQDSNGCGVMTESGWWFSANYDCLRQNLNGKWASGMFWGRDTQVTNTEMKVRHV